MSNHSHFRQRTSKRTFTRCSSIFCTALLGIIVMTSSSISWAALVSTSGSDQSQRAAELRARIASIAIKERKPAIDAKIDPVWRAVPALNGIEVDQEESSRQSLRQAKRLEPVIVYRTLAPKVTLRDLNGEPIYRGNPEKHAVSLMINVAWGEEHLPKMLETLRAEHVHCTFFLDGSWLSKHESLARQILADGHELANHAYSHPDMARISFKACEEQIDKTNVLLKAVTGKAPTLFAPPSGSYNKNALKIAFSRQMHTILWTADTVDWKRPPASVIAGRVSRRVVPGALVLMHPTAPTAKALPVIIKELKQKGYRIITVSEMISPDRLTSS